MSEGGFPDQSCHGGEVVEHVSQKDECGDTGQTINRQALETPGFEGGVACFDGVSCPMVSGLPGRAANGDISDKADGTIRETLPNVDDATMGMVGLLVRAIRGWIDNFWELDLGCGVFQTSFLANPFAASVSAVIAIGLQAVAIGADWATTVIITPQDPILLVPVGLVSTQVDHPAGLEVVIDSL